MKTPTKEQIDKITTLAVLNGLQYATQYIEFAIREWEKIRS